MGLLRAIRAAARAFPERYAFEMSLAPRERTLLERISQKRWATDNAVGAAQGAAFDVLEPLKPQRPVGNFEGQKLPNRARLTVSPLGDLPWSPRDVSWQWEDMGFNSALKAGKRSRHEIAETMNAAMNKVGRRALASFPTEYEFAGLTPAHNRLYARNAKRLEPFYSFDGYALTPTPLAYALYGARRGAQGAGLGGLAAIMAPEDAY